MRVCGSGVRKSGVTGDSQDEDPDGEKCGESCDGNQYTNDTRVTFHVTPVPCRVGINTPVLRSNQRTPTLARTEFKSPKNFSREEVKTRKETPLIPATNAVDV